MRVTSVELHPVNSPEAVVLSYRDPGRLNPYNVRGITGLDADEIVPRYYGGSGDTAFYNLSLQKRDIGIQISLSPRYELDESYSSLRDYLYKMISSSRTGMVEIQFKNENVVVAVVSGFVTKFEAAVFEKEPGLVVTVKCNKPMLQTPDPVAVDVSLLNPDLTVITDNLSTAPHGFKFKLGLVTAVPSFKIHDPNDPSWSFEVFATAYGGFAAGDEIHFSSEQDDKYLRLSRGGVVSPFAEGIVSGSMWPILFPGANTFKVDGVAVDVNGTRNMHWIEISHYPTYWGV